MNDKNENSDNDLESPPGDGLIALRPQPSLADQTNYLPTRQIIIVFCGCALAVQTSLLDQTTVSTALSSITSDFNAGDISSWVATAYMMTSTCFQPLHGRFSDIFGRKNVLLVALLVFFLGSLASSLAQTIIQLIIFRAITGIGGGGLITLSQVIISDVVSLRDRGKYQGIIGSVVALSNGLGPLVGGALAEKNWRWVFRLNLPLSAIAGVVVFFKLPLKHVTGSYKKKLSLIDYLGTFLMLASCVLILLALHWGGLEKAWQSAATLCPLVIGTFLGVLFSFWEWRGAKLPILPMHLFKNSTAAGVLITTAVNGYVFFTQLYYLPQWYQTVWNKSPVEAGVLLLPFVVTQSITSTLAGWYVSKVGRYVGNIYVGWGLWSIGIGLLSTLDKNSSLGKLIGYLILSGVGAGQTLQITLIALQAAVARKDMAVATSARNFMRNFGGTIALAVGASVINNVFQRYARKSMASLPGNIIDSVIRDPTSIQSRKDLTSAERDTLINAYEHGFRILFLVISSLAALTFFVAVCTIRHHELSRKDEKVLKEESKKWLESYRKKRTSTDKGNENTGIDDEIGNNVSKNNESIPLPLISERQCDESKVHSTSLKPNEDSINE